MPDAPRAAVQPPRDPSERVSWPTPGQPPSPAQFGATTTLPPMSVDPARSDDATIDLTEPPRSANPIPAPALSRASFGWRPDEQPQGTTPQEARGQTPAATPSTPPTPSRPISTRSALITLVGVVLILGGGVAFWLGQRTDTTDPAVASPVPSTPRTSPDITVPPASAPASSIVPAPTVPSSFPDTVAGQAAEFERSIGAAGLANLAAYRAALTTLGDTIPLENGDPTTYGVRIQTAANDTFNAATAVIESLQSASVGPLVLPYVDDLRRTLGQVSASANIVAACDPTQPCGPDILTVRTHQQDAYLAVTLLDGLTP